MNTIRTIVAALLAFSAAVASASAHEFWISPQSGTLDPGAMVVGDLKIGVRMRGEPYPYLSDRFQTFSVTAGGETTAVEGFEGDLPALSYVADRPGLQIVAHHTIAFRATYDDWAVFERYLEEEGLPEVADLHRARGLPETGFAERYTRCAKALVQVGPIGPADRDALTGMPLELVAAANPYASGTDILPVTLFWGGVPVANRQINIFRDDGSVTRKTMTTDSDGQVRIPIEGGGEYLLNAVNIEAVEDAPVVWASHWATLSFSLQQRD